MRSRRNSFHRYRRGIYFFSFSQNEWLLTFIASFAANYSTLSAAGTMHLAHQDLLIWHAIVLFFYDFVLTFPLEVQSIWRGKMNTMKILFFITRYSTVLLFCVLIPLYFAQPVTNAVCVLLFSLFIRKCWQAFLGVSGCISNPRFSKVNIRQMLFFELSLWSF